jgi:multiple sugar transport system permease protein
VTFILNSTKIAVLSVIGQLLSCSMAAFCFARFEFPGRNALFMILLATLMVPGQVTLIPVFLVMRALGWVDTHYALIVPAWLGGAFGTFLLRQFFLTVPRELEDAARIDGASSFAIYSRIFLPLAKPALATLAVLGFMGSWNDLLGPVIYLQTRSKMTLPVGLALFKGQYVTEYALLNTGATISLIPILILFILAQNYFVQGLTMTGLKV